VRVSEVISSLTAKGYISAEIDQAAGNKRILHTLIKKPLRPSQRKVDDPHKEKFAHSNISNSTKNKTHTEACVVNGREAFTTSSSSEQSEVILDGLRSRLRCVILPRETEWLQHIDWAVANKFEPDQFLACYDFLKNQDWRTSPVRAEHVATSLPDFVATNVPVLPKWMTDRDACTKCDDRGYVLLDGKHQVCKH
jgi:hypothetical protein